MAHPLIRLVAIRTARTLGINRRATDQQESDGYSHAGSQDSDKNASSGSPSLRRRVPDRVQGSSLLPPWNGPPTRSHGGADGMRYSLSSVTVLIWYHRALSPNVQE